MKKIIEYMTISYDEYEIDEEVNRHIAAGWQPFGGPAIERIDDEDRSSTFLHQAMVKYEN